MQKLAITLMMFTCALMTGQMTTTYELDTNKSVIYWKGTYAFQFSEHNGTVNFTEGQLYTVNDQITGGDFTIDMTTINNEDYKLDRGPVKHLKDEDFFDVLKFPEATLKIKSIEYFENTNTHEVFADITIKGATKTQKFYAVADATTGTFDTKFKIDRTRWGITYNNKLKNKAISEAVEFDVKLVFKNLNDEK